MRRCFYAIFAMFVLLPASVQAGPPVPGTGCDSEFMSVMEVRAWMQGKQDYETAQELLTRSNSVMELSCFDMALGHLGNFSDTRYAGLGTTNAIQRLARSILNSYYNNFTRTGSPGAVCALMRNMWQTSKCGNFDKDKFRTFAQMQTTDGRINFQVCPLANNHRNLWIAAIPASNPVPALPQRLGGMDRVTSHMNILAPISCNSTVAVETGLMVSTVAIPIPFREKACLAPGCWFNNVSNRCENQ